MTTSFIQPDLLSPERSLPNWPFAPLTPQAYSLIMIDCPWHFKTRSKLGEAKSPQAYYRTMTIEEITALPVADLASDDCILWMWGTAPMIDVQISIMKRWGFKFSTSGVWVKFTKHGKLNFGTGYFLRNCHEIFLIGTRGDPEITARNIRSVIMAPAREYSRKPDEAYEAARRMMPYGRAADVFSRETRDGWETFGDEAGKFDQLNGAINGTDKGTSTGKPGGRRGRKPSGRGTLVDSQQ